MIYVLLTVLLGLFLWVQIVEQVRKDEPIFPVFRKTKAPLKKEEGDI